MSISYPMRILKTCSEKGTFFQRRQLKMENHHHITDISMLFTRYETEIVTL